MRPLRTRSAARGTHVHSRLRDSVAILEGSGIFVGRHEHHRPRIDVGAAAKIDDDPTCAAYRQFHRHFERGDVACVERPQISGESVSIRLEKTLGMVALAL